MSISGQVEGQISHSCFSLNIGPFISLSRTDLNTDPMIYKRSALKVAPQVGYNILLRNGDVFALGLGYFGSGDHIRYADNPYSPFTRINYSSYVLSSSLFYNRKLAFISEKLFICGGAVMSYISYDYGFISSDTLAEIRQNGYGGFKTSLSTGMKYDFRVKSRVIGIDLNYIQGLTTFSEILTRNKITNNQNRYVNKGSGIQLRLICYFGKHDNGY